MELKKQLSFLDVFCLACGAMISSGIFILPGIAFSQAGPGVIFSYFLAGILALIGTFSVIELTTALPKAGGDYFFVIKTLGPLTGTISGLLSWLAISLKTAFAIFGIAEILFIFFGINLYLSSICLCIFFTSINILGAKEVTKFEVLLVLSLFSLLILYIVFGVHKVNPDHFAPFTPYGWSSIISTAGFIFVSFGGLLNIASISEEIKNPKKNVPLALLAAVVCISILYTLILIVTVGLLPAEILSSSSSPIADGAKVLIGQPGFICITIAALLAFVTTAIAGLLSASRYPFGLSRDGLLPAFIGKVNKKSNTPTVAVIITGLLIIFSLLLGLDLLVKSASTVILTAYVLTNLSVIVLRESKIRNYRPSFRVPLYPWIPIFNIIIFTALIIDMGLGSIEISLGFILAGIVIYVVYGRKNSKKEFALIYFIERLVNKKLTDHTLENELMHILHERDDIVKDRFDHLVQDASVIDVEEHINKETFFQTISQKIAAKIHMDPEKLCTLLEERENDSSTAISPFVAIPHIILEGEKKFELCLVRCKKGITFSEDHADVKAIFMLLGTLDERQFHLQALAAIAQIVQDPEFKKLWLAAGSTNHLRDIILLGQRQRH